MTKLEFNEDGSIKIPQKIINENKEKERVFEEEPSIRIKRNQISNTTPVNCRLILEAS